MPTATSTSDQDDQWTPSLTIGDTVLAIYPDGSVIRTDVLGRDWSLLRLTNEGHTFWRLRQIPKRGRWAVDGYGIGWLDEGRSHHYLDIDGNYQSLGLRLPSTNERLAAQAKVDDGDI